MTSVIFSYINGSLFLVYFTVVKTSQTPIKNMIHTLIFT